MACPKHPYPLGHLAFRLFDHSFEQLVLDILSQADEALVNESILLPFEVFAFKYSMESFAEHVRIDSKTNTSKVTPSCYMWYPLPVKIFCKCSCCRRAVKTLAKYFQIFIKQVFICLLKNDPEPKICLCFNFFVSNLAS